LSSHAKDYIKASAPHCASASMGNAVMKLKTPPSAAIYTQKMSRSQTCLVSIPTPSSKPVSQSSLIQILNLYCIHASLFDVDFRHS